MPNKVEATVENNQLVIRMPIAVAPSKSGKTLVVASTHGFMDTTATIEGKAVRLGFTAFIPR